jgi:peptidoglycan hydrolase-like amidase
VVERKGGRWTFHGGGWGHGVGMCQMGAIGRAERGQGHREILGHYYGGARTVRLYPSGGRQQAEVTADKSPSLSISR